MQHPTLQNLKSIKVKIMNTFNYIILKETEKAIFASVPYWEETSENVKKHKQLFFECWIPKAILEKGIAKEFVIAKRNEKRLQNSYQKMCKMPISYQTFGQYAPEKGKQLIEVIDYDKLSDIKKMYENKYGCNYMTILQDEIATNDDHKIIVELFSPSVKSIYTPKKILTIYK